MLLRYPRCLNFCLIFRFKNLIPKATIRVMPHHIYQTEGFILGSQNSGEADKRFALFTKDLGFVSATSRGVRRLQSKSRFVLQDFAFSDFSLVRGLAEWRLISARESLRAFRWLGLDNPARLFWARINLLLRRLLHGEEHNQELFKILVAASDFLAEAPPESDLELAEPILVTRILHVLGYLPNELNLHKFISSTGFSRELLDEAKALRSQMVVSINKSLAETQL